MNRPEDSEEEAPRLATAHGTLRVPAFLPDATRAVVRCLDAADLQAVVCLDHCTHPDAPPDVQRQSVEHTIDWARRCRVEFDRLTADRPRRRLLFAVVQGGADPQLRRRCADALREIGFDGYGFGGWPVGPDGRLSEMVAAVAEHLGRQRPLWGLGIGKPVGVAAAASVGYELFDCVIPTRDARHRRLYVWQSDPPRTPGAGSGFYRALYIQDERYTRDAAPLDAGCDCPCCRRYSRAYLHHLFWIGDGPAARLATLHNLRFYTRLMAKLREAARPDATTESDPPPPG